MHLFYNHICVYREAALYLVIDAPILYAKAETSAILPLRINLFLTAGMINGDSFDVKVIFRTGKNRSIFVNIQE